ncbi:TPA: hypothetical protein VGS91_004860 [Citrobacter freundii]|nr:hypothetical protein [Citrobacter freundii]
MSVKKVNECTPQTGCSTVWNVLHIAAENIPTERERDNVRCDAEAHRDALLSGLETLLAHCCRNQLMVINSTTMKL